MTKRLPCPPPGPLEDYAAQFDALFTRLAQRRGLHAYLQGLLLPRDRNNRNTGAGCVKPPLTDDHVPVDFYPFYSATTGYGPACAWAFGNGIPGHTVNDFGQINQYGPLLRLTYLLFEGLGATTSRFNDFRNIVSGNPCTAQVVGRT